MQNKTKTRHIDIGTRVQRKRDGAMGTIVNRSLAVSSFSRPGVYGKTVLDVRLDDPALNEASGGDQVGEIGWLTSYYRIL